MVGQEATGSSSGATDLKLEFVITNESYHYRHYALRATHPQHRGGVDLTSFAVKNVAGRRKPHPSQPDGWLTRGAVRQELLSYLTLALAGMPFGELPKVASSFTSPSLLIQPLPTTEGNAAYFLYELTHGYSTAPARMGDAHVKALTAAYSEGKQRLLVETPTTLLAVMRALRPSLRELSDDEFLTVIPGSLEKAHHLLKDESYRKLSAALLLRQVYPTALPPEAPLSTPLDKHLTWDDCWSGNRLMHMPILPKKVSARLLEVSPDEFIYLSSRLPSGGAVSTTLTIIDKLLQKRREQDQEKVSWERRSRSETMETFARLSENAHESSFFYQLPDLLKKLMTFTNLNGARCFYRDLVLSQPTTVDTQALFREAYGVVTMQSEKWLSQKSHHEYLLELMLDHTTAGEAYSLIKKVAGTQDAALTALQWERILTTPLLATALEAPAAWWIPLARKG